MSLQAHLTELDLSDMEKLVALPSRIGMLKGLVKLDVSVCSKLGSMPQEIGDLENLVKLDANDTQISQPPSSIVRLNNLIFLSFEGLRLEDVEMIAQLGALQILHLTYCERLTQLQKFPKKLNTIFADWRNEN
ncbi:hypothetical protein H5410_030122 [Solanum commersonii]|uniref:Uncharacterized protein n=1 Tax=Solanum commersonii TaxID=4109 RepID=A0A9J5YGJ5_SOLCO|nr:hypothetical protein H5410_030122 [Solanum commersonii]